MLTAVKERVDAEAYVQAPVRANRNSRVAHVAVFLSLWLAATYLQWLSGAFAGAFGSQWDEPSHYVTGLMIRDYIAAWLPRNPIAFAESYYLHYPRVAFGIWPPLYHLASGVWMFVFGEDRRSVLAMLAAVTACWGYVFFRMLRPRFGFAASAVAALLLISLPASQYSSFAVMLDMAAALAILVAMVQFGRYLESESLRDSLLFGLYAGLAALVKYNGLLLALLPPLCVLLTGRYSLLKRKAFWLPAIVVLALAGPWYFTMRNLVAYAAEPGQPMRFGAAASWNTISLVGLAGPLLFALAMIGAGLAIRSARRQAQSAGEHTAGVHVNQDIAAIGTLAATWLFHSALYPILDVRYLLPAAAALILLALRSVDTAARRVRITPLSARGLRVAAMSLMIIPYAAFTFQVPRKDTGDFVKVADKVLAQSLPANSVVLVAADGMGEGMFISEIAMRRPRFQHFVARSSKLLVRQGLMRQDYTHLFETSAEMMAALDAVPISMAVIDDCVRQQCEEHVQRLSNLASDMPERWKLSDAVTKQSGGQVRIFTLKGNERKPLNRLSLDMRYTLGRSIGASGGN